MLKGMLPCFVVAGAARSGLGREKVSALRHTHR